MSCAKHRPGLGSVAKQLAATQGVFAQEYGRLALLHASHATLEEL